MMHIPAVISGKWNDVFSHKTISVMFCSDFDSHRILNLRYWIMLICMSVENDKLLAEQFKLTLLPGREHYSETIYDS